MNERHDDLQEIIDAALREMAAEEGDGFDPQAYNLTSATGTGRLRRPRSSWGGSRPTLCTVVRSGSISPSGG